MTLHDSMDADAPPGQVLIVDDDVASIQVLRRMLPDGLVTRFATNGEDALRLARSDPPDLILLDADMPGMGGVEVCKRLKAEPELSAVPVVFVTSHAQPEFEAMAMDLGAVDFIAKPLVADKVRARVAARLRDHLRGRVPMAGRAPGSAQDPAQQAHRPDRILVVDDDAVALHLIERHLASLDCVVQTARGGAEALQRLAGDPPDLVLLDSRMPGLDGMAVLRRMQKDPRLQAVPVVFVTQYSDPQTEALTLEAGATDFIAKPINPAVLVARIRSVLRAKRENEAALQALSSRWKAVSHARLADAVAAASDAMLCLDAAGCVVLANHACEKLLACRTPELLGRPLPPWLYQPGPTEALGPMRAQGPITEWEAGPYSVRLEPPGRAALTVDLSISRSGQGEDALTTLVMRDASERERLAREILARREEETRSRTRSMMLGYMAHEIGNPLNVVLGFAQVMAADSLHPLPPEQARRLDLIVQSAEQLRALMGDLMELSRAGADKLSMRLQGLDVVTLLRSAVERHAAQAAAVAVTCRVLAPDQPCRVMADPARLTQCLDNVVSNAIKYNRRGGAVTIDVSADADRVVVGIDDEGEGLDADQRDRLFEPFNRLGREHSQVRGSGLGLAVTKVLLEAMQGEIRVLPRQGGGTRFELALMREPLGTH